MSVSFCMYKYLNTFSLVIVDLFDGAFNISTAKVLLFLYGFHLETNNAFWNILHIFIDTSLWDPKNIGKLNELTLNWTHLHNGKSDLNVQIIDKKWNIQIFFF